MFYMCDMFISELKKFLLHLLCLNVLTPYLQILFPIRIHLNGEWATSSSIVKLYCGNVEWRVWYICRIDICYTFSNVCSRLPCLFLFHPVWSLYELLSLRCNRQTHCFASHGIFVLICVHRIYIEGATSKYLRFSFIAMRANEIIGYHIVYGVH